MVLLVNRFSIIGGDKRNIYLAESIKKDGYEVNIYGLDCKDSQGFDLELVNKSDCIIMGIPFKEDKFFEITNMTINEFLTKIDNKICFGGSFGEENINIHKDIKLINLLKIEEFAVLNAIPTAEGAIKVAIEQTDFTLHGANVIVSGFGRIGKVLCKMLVGIGAKVYTVSADSVEIAMAKSYGYNTVKLEDVESILPYANIIFNTVPENIYINNLIDRINKKCVYIELASLPYGIDINYAKSKNIKMIIASGLPSEVAPKTAGEYVKSIIYSTIEKQV